jgi:transglutaminase superfamily protein
MTMQPPTRPRLGLPQRASLIAEILAAYIRVRLELRRSDLRGSVGKLRADPGRVGNPQVIAGDDPESGIRLGQAVVRTLRVLPTDSRCLMRSLVLTRLLARRGVESRFVLGVQSGDEFRAHAWVERGDTPLLAAGERFERLLEI